MKTVLLFLLLAGFAVYPVFSQSLRYAVAQPYISLSAYSLEQQNPLSFTGNQAALARFKNAGIGVYGERRFMLAENSVYTLAASLPTRLGNFGIHLNYAGFKNFTENKIGMAYARKLGKLVDVGVQFNYYSYRVPAYGNASTINFEVGTILHVTDKLQAGMQVYNPVGGKMGKDKSEKLAAAYSFGLGYDASENIFICTQIIKEEDKRVNVIVGLQYHVAKRFFIKAGVMSESTTLYAGAGIAWKNIQLDIVSGYHPQLGFSPGLLFIMNFKPVKK